MAAGGWRIRELRDSSELIDDELDVKWFCALLEEELKAE